MIDDILVRIVSNRRESRQERAFSEGIQGSRVASISKYIKR
jgi:hypothetical protein